MNVTDNKQLAGECGLTYMTIAQMQTLKDDIEIAVCSRGNAKKLLEMSCGNLKYIQLTSAGYDGLNPQDFREKGIMLCRAADVYHINMAEFVVYAMLMNAKKFNRSIRNRCIRPLRNYHYITELYGKTVGIMGVGNIGAEVASRLSAFGMRVIGYAKYTDVKEPFEKIYHQDQLLDFVASCDYIVNTLPHNCDTIGLLGQEAFANMRPHVMIMNEGRRSIFVEKAFINFFRKHRDASAVLDMMELMPNPLTNAYRRLRNVIVWPGVVASSQETDQRLISLVEDNMHRYQNDETLINQL